MKIIQGREKEDKGKDVEWREDNYTAQFSDMLWDFEGSWNLLSNTDVSFLFWRQVATAPGILPKLMRTGLLACSTTS